jgi:hypothetical protein
VRTTLLAMTAGTAMIGIAALTSSGVRAFDAASEADAQLPMATVSTATS